jgi:AraC-like DNA-binding protein
MSLPVLLWVDCVAGSRDEALPSSCSEFFQLSACSEPERIDVAIHDCAPRALCFDFDYPLEAHLGVMQSVKRRHPGLPVLMVTLEHSEALAVWAFRSRVWNYLVKPVAPQEWRANLQVLARLAALGNRQRRELRLPGPAVATMGGAGRSAAAYATVRRALEHIDRHFHETCTATELAVMVGVSPFRFSRDFRAAVGVTFQEYLLRHRIGEACRILEREPRAGVSEVAGRVGFNDSSYFARMFRRYMSVKPSQYARGERADATGAASEVLEVPVMSLVAAPGSR